MSHHPGNPPPYTPGPSPHSGMGPPPPGIKPGYVADPPLQPIHPPHQSSTQSSTTHVVITSGPYINFGPGPQHMVCPSCHAQITTTIKTEPNTKTHLFALILCLFQCYCCCCIPYCVDSCQSQNHYCPHCQAFLGGYNN